MGYGGGVESGMRNGVGIAISVGRVNMETARNRKIRSDNLDCWRHARDLTVHIHRLISENHLKKDSELKEALTKTTVYLMSHIAMGNGNATPESLESLKHLDLALECLAVLRTYLGILRELGYLSEGDFLDFEDQSIHIEALIDDQIKNLRKKQKRKR
ncbi:MAG: four helix bundle protein [Candidatus Aminicenantes bacterium]|nr:four helix bundle protein [Candidatus Aminicenantes bacterium]